jgi:hypothetical protein
MKFNKMKKIIFFGLSLLMVSCSSSLGVSNGAYSDISLNRDSKEYTIKRLKEINTESNAVFGIPIDKSLSKKQGLVVRFNGINLTASSRILPILSMVGLSLVTGSAIQAIAGYKYEEPVNDYYGGYYGSYEEIKKPNMSLGVATLLAIPVAGFINNQIWNGALNRAAWQANAQLLKENDDIDVFLNPKYDIETSRKIWTQHAKLKARVMGAKIKTDN